MATQSSSEQQESPGRVTPRKGIRPRVDGLASRKTRIMIVDDHAIVREGYRSLIACERDLEVCAEAAGQSEAMRLAFHTVPDMAIVDINLQEGSGLELIRDLKSQRPDLKILAVSAHDEMLFAERTLRAGALGYVNKREAAEHLVGALRRVLQRKVAISQEVTDCVLNHCVGLSRPADESPLAALTDRELEVFELIGHGKTTRQVAAALYLSPKTIETYRENIKLKLNLQNATQLLQHAVQWVLEGR